MKNANFNYKIELNIDFDNISENDLNQIINENIINMINDLNIKNSEIEVNVKSDNIIEL